MGVSSTPDMYIIYPYTYTDAQVEASDFRAPTMQVAIWWYLNDKWTRQFDFDPSWVRYGLGYAVTLAPPDATHVSNVCLSGGRVVDIDGTLGTERR